MDDAAESASLGVSKSRFVADLDLSLLFGLVSINLAYSKEAEDEVLFERPLTLVSLSINGDIACTSFRMTGTYVYFRLHTRPGVLVRFLASFLVSTRR